MGNGLDESTNLGPIQNVMQYDRLKAFVASLEDDELNIVAGDVKHAFSQGMGYFMNPLILDNPPDESRVVVEEPFGKFLPYATRSHLKD